MERRNIYYKVLDYPVVQYITLRQKILYSGDVKDTRTDIKMIQTEAELESYIKFYKIDSFDTAVDFNNNIVVIALNYSISDTKYRTNRVYTFGNVEVARIQISSFSKDLFYRKQLYFLCYDWQGEKLPIYRQVYLLD
ncbi:MAG: hypothetical protein APF76_04175 [Desulfitibacter sp. BRH_c19]|nr:MAG: hypothetical protein APF76_04175 [Desulfitibacter sp. BRH_c19]